MAHWIQDAEAALSGKTTDERVQIVQLRSPPVLDAVGVRAVLAPFLAAFFWAAVQFRETLHDAPFDSLTLLLRLLAFALTARSLIMLHLLGGRLRERLRFRRYGLALCEEGLLYRSPGLGDVAVPKQDILEIKERGHWRNRGGRRWAHVYLVTRPDSGRLYVALPPVFRDTPGLLAEQLMRWCGPTETPQQMPEHSPTELPSKLFDQVAAGDRPAGIAVVKHGWGWLSRGPYFTFLLGLAILDTFMRLPPDTRVRLGAIAPLIVLFTVLVVPVLWFVMTRVDISPRKGIALILTPAEMLMRTRAGVHRMAWKDLESMEVESRTIWSVLRGAHESRSVVFTRDKSRLDSVSYVEAFLGAPAEVVLGLCDAYRKGILGSEEAAATASKAEPTPS